MIHDDGQRIALFRYQVIAPLVSLSGPRGTLKREIRRLAERSHEHPMRGRVTLSFPTIEEWLYLYRRSGLEGLVPTSRRDRGKSRAIDEERSERIEALVDGRPDLDGRAILAELKTDLADGETLPSLSSLYRFLRARGLDGRRSAARRDHRAYAFELAGDCWQGDVMYGPALGAKDGTRRKTYLIAIIDDATRLIAHAEFYLEQHLRSLKDTLKQALQKRGVPRRFYFDNGMIFRSRMLLGVCARLGIELIHSRPFKPQGRAKIERWFLSVRRAFLCRVDLQRVEDLAALNRLLFAWVEGEYHQRAHRGLQGETPLDCWIRLSDGIRPLPLDVDLDELFLEETTRRVTKDGTLTLKGKTFEAGPSFIAQRVVVRFDPFDLRRVLIGDGEGKKTDAFPVDLHANRHVRRSPPPEPRESKTPPPPLRAMEDLADRIEKEKEPDREKEDNDEQER